MESLQIKQRGKAQEREECFYEATFKYFFAHKYTTGEWPRLTKEVTSWDYVTVSEAAAGNHVTVSEATAGDHVTVSETTAGDHVTVSEDTAGDHVTVSEATAEPPSRPCQPIKRKKNGLPL